MARGVNKQILIGNLGSDPQLKTLPSGDSVLNIQLAVTDQWTDSKGEKQSNTDWFRLSFYKKAAEVFAQHAFKGMRVYIEGQTRNRTYEKNGEKTYISEVLVREFQFLSFKEDSASVSTSPAPQAEEPAPVAAGFTDNDDLPF